METEITRQLGEVAEIELPTAFNWSMSVDDPDHILVPRQPQQTEINNLQMTKWSFETIQRGTATIRFTSTPARTGQGIKRPLLAITREFTITIT